MAMTGKNVQDRLLVDYQVNEDSIIDINFQDDYILLKHYYRDKKRGWAKLFDRKRKQKFKVQDFVGVVSVEQKLQLLFCPGHKVQNTTMKRSIKKSLPTSIININGKIFDLGYEQNRMNQEIRALIKQQYALNCQDLQSDATYASINNEPVARRILMLINSKAGKGINQDLIDKKLQPILQCNNYQIQTYFSKAPMDLTKFLKNIQYDDHTLDYAQKEQQILQQNNYIHQLEHDVINLEQQRSYNKLIQQSQGSSYDFDQQQDAEKIQDLESFANQAPVVGKLDCIAVVGGDGTVHEVIQGMVQNDNYQNLLRVPICHVPTGSGNALARSCGFITPEDAVFGIVKQNIQGLDLATVYQPQGIGLRYSFYGFQYSMMADIDIKSEWLRCLGDLRFIIQGVIEMIKSKGQKAQLQIVRKQSNINKQSELSVLQQSKIGSRFPTPYIEQSLQFGQYEINQRTQDILWEEHEAPKQGYQLLMYGNIPYLTKSDCFFPQVKMNDGSWAGLLAGPKPFHKMANLYLKLDSQKHLGLPWIEKQDVVAIKFVPQNQVGTHLTIDGELFPLKPTYFEVHNQVAYIIKAS